MSVASPQLRQHLVGPKYGKTCCWLDLLQAKRSKVSKGLSCGRVYKLKTSQTGFSLSERVGLRQSINHRLLFALTRKPADHPCPAIPSPPYSPQQTPARGHGCHQDKEQPGLLWTTSPQRGWPSRTHLLPVPAPTGRPQGTARSRKERRRRRSPGAVR